MTKLRTLILLFFLLVPSAQFAQTPRAGKIPGSGRTASNKSIIGYVHREHIGDGCGCSYHFKNEPNWTVYSNVYSDTGGSIWMNIDGQDVKLKFVSSESAPKGEARKGQRITTRYAASGIKVRIDTIDRGDYGEGRDYVGTITVMKGSRKQTVQVVGSCGC